MFSQDGRTRYRRRRPRVRYARRHRCLGLQAGQIERGSCEEMRKNKIKLSIVALAAIALCAGFRSQNANVGWLYNGGPQGDHYSPLTQITPANVSQLQQGW